MAWISKLKNISGGKVNKQKMLKLSKWTLSVHVYDFRLGKYLEEQVMIKCLLLG